MSTMKQKGTGTQGRWGTLTNGVHPRDHLILAQVLAGLVVGRAPQVKQQALDTVSLGKRQQMRVLDAVQWFPASNRAPGGMLPALLPGLGPCGLSFILSSDFWPQSTFLLASGCRYAGSRGFLEQPV